MTTLYTKLLEKPGNSIFLFGPRGTGTADQPAYGERRLRGKRLERNPERKHLPVRLHRHLKGAFTGADRDRPGRFRSADTGTILLDEVGDLPPEIQPKLLRVLENKTLIPVGAEREITVEVRILAATNQDLEKLIEEGSFRRDLYQRLNQVTLQLPPLRERFGDQAEEQP